MKEQGTLIDELGKALENTILAIESYIHPAATTITLEEAKAVYAKYEKLKQTNMSARDHLDAIIGFGDEWKQKASDSAGAIAGASGLVGGLSSYVRGGVENSANWKSKGRILGSLAGGGVAGLGGYAIAKTLKKSSNQESRTAGRIGVGHQNSLSSRDQLDSIINFGGDPRPRDPLGRFDDEDNGGVTPESTSITYGGGKQQQEPSEEKLRALIEQIKARK